MFFTYQTMSTVLAALLLAVDVHAAAIISPEEIKTRLATRDVQSPINGLPSCNGKENDPTWAVGKSSYADGVGKYLGPDCYNGHGDSKCWTDYFLVGTTQRYGSVTQPAGTTNCGAVTGDTCTQSLANMHMGCTTYTMTATTTISEKVSIEAVDLGVDFSVSVSEAQQSCSSNTTTNSCTWPASPQCHAASVAPLIIDIHGYMRRSCKAPDSDSTINMPNQPKRADGYYTRGMMDFTIPLVKSQTVRCDGKCNEFAPWASPDGGKFTNWAA